VRRLINERIARVIQCAPRGKCYCLPAIDSGIRSRPGNYNGDSLGPGHAGRESAFRVVALRRRVFPVSFVKSEQNVARKSVIPFALIIRHRGAPSDNRR